MSRWKQGDTKPDMVIDCFDGDGRPAPLNTATVLKIIVRHMGALKWERAVTGNAQGQIVMPLQNTDTADPGTYKVKVYAEWPDGKRQHYPPADEYLTMTVTR